jgi:hypothetical protein
MCYTKYSTLTELGILVYMLSMSTPKERAPFSLAIDRDFKYTLFGLATLFPLHEVREHVLKKGLLVPGEEEIEYCLSKPLSDVTKPLRFRNWDVRSVFFGALNADDSVATLAWEPRRETFRRSKLPLWLHWDNSRGRVITRSSVPRES